MQRCLQGRERRVGGPNYSVCDEPSASSQPVAADVSAKNRAHRGFWRNLALRCLAPGWRGSLESLCPESCSGAYGIRASPETLHRLPSPVRGGVAEKAVRPVHELGTGFVRALQELGDGPG